MPDGESKPSMPSPTSIVIEFTDHVDHCFSNSINFLNDHFHGTKLKGRTVKVRIEVVDAE